MGPSLPRDDFYQVRACDLDYLPCLDLQFTTEYVFHKKDEYEWCNSLYPWKQLSHPHLTAVFPSFFNFKNSRSFMACMQKKMNPFISSWNLYRLRCRRFSILHTTPPQTRNPWKKIPIPNPKNNRQ